MTDIFVGLIMVWSSGSSTIPEGWQICDGTNGTPDLRGLFPYGKNDDADAPTTGGASSHLHSGTNSSSAGAHGHGFSLSIGSSGGTSTVGTSDKFAAGGPSHNVNASSLNDSTLNHTHTTNLSSSSSLPPHSYAYYIMKVL